MKECQLCKNCYTDDVATCPKDGMPTMHTIAGEPVLEGKYHLESRLGQGGMGVVYKARHAYLKTQLAIKIILPDLVGNDPQLVTRFRQEALAAAAIRHQNVVAVTDYGVIQGSIPFLVMEYVDGESLHDLLTREKRLTPEKALELMTAICWGVGAAHHQGIVHRDLKPLNIMICKDKPSISQAVKILDFGLAKIKSGELLGSFIQAQTTGLMGSPYYMAPEQWADDEPDSRSDIYSLGVMLYQMLAGDVPFKGSSIPAIMKKHISDPAPRFAEVGVAVSPEVEAAVLHTLKKEKEQRTSSVEQMIQEFKDAVFPPSIGIHTTSGTGSALPISTLNVLTNPPRSQVYVDNIAVGETRDDGWITLNGVQSGNHRLRVSKSGFNDWFGDVVCDGRPQQVVADLAGAATNVPAPTVAFSSGGVSQNTPQNLSSTLGSMPDALKTQFQHHHTGEQQSAVISQPPKRSFISPLVLAIVGVMVLGGLGVAGVGGAWFMGWIPGSGGGGTNGIDIANARKTPTPEPDTPQQTKPDLATITGGTFTMGRNEGGNLEKPEHQVTVKDFMMDKTEVTNAEFLEFIKASSYKPSDPKNYLVHWVNDAPKPGEERMPVRFVNIEDVTAFAKWRSGRDKVTYRLPTEQEWEYSARNGIKQYLYPWGDAFRKECAVLDEDSNDPKPVGSTSCASESGVHDLIGNVLEWTSNEAWLYPGSPGEIRPFTEKVYMVRGGSARYNSTGSDAATSTFRTYSPGSNRHDALGFRLVRDK